MANISVNTTLLNETTNYDDDFITWYLSNYTALLNETANYDDDFITWSLSNYTVLLNGTIDFNHNGYMDEFHKNVKVIKHVVTCIIISVGLPLLLMAIYFLYSLVKNRQVAPIYIINLFISDLIQLCCLIVQEFTPEKELSDQHNIVGFVIYKWGLLTSVGFMVCISLERYLLIAHPLWYRLKRTIRISVVVCVLVWIIPPVLSLTVFLWAPRSVIFIIFPILFIIPFPLFIFFLVGTLRALSASVSVPSDEKRRIVAILVLVLLIYTLLFLPYIILFTAGKYFSDFTLRVLSSMFLRLSPLADLLLYVFIKKETFRKLWTSVCCCRKENNDSNNINIELDHM